MIAGPEFGTEEGKTFLFCQGTLWSQVGKLQLQILHGREVI